MRVGGVCRLSVIITWLCVWIIHRSPDRGNRNRQGGAVPLVDLRVCETDGALWNFDSDSVPIFLAGYAAIRIHWVSQGIAQVFHWRLRWFRDWFFYCSPKNMCWWIRIFVACYFRMCPTHCFTIIIEVWVVKGRRSHRFHFCIPCGSTLICTPHPYSPHTHAH